MTLQKILVALAITVFGGSVAACGGTTSSSTPAKQQTTQQVQPQQDQTQQGQTQQTQTQNNEAAASTETSANQDQLQQQMQIAANLPQHEVNVDIPIHLRANSNTSDAFAIRVFNAYNLQANQTGADNCTLSVYSPITHTTYDEHYTTDDTTVWASHGSDYVTFQVADLFIAAF